MRIVAVRAGHLALANRMARRTVNLGALILVAGKAHLRLRQLVAYFVVRCVHLVAGGASRIPVGVSTALPVYALAPLMTGKAGLILHIG